jgi:hypothetical protein
MKVMMSSMMRKIEARWQALDPAPDKPVFQLLDAEHPLKLYIGREMTGEYLFLLVDPEQPPKLKGLRSVHIRTFKRDDGQWHLLLSLTQPELAGVFALLCEDLVESSRQLARGSSGVNLLSRRLANWRLLLEEGGSGLLTTEVVRGLIGELLVLDRYFMDLLGPVAAVNIWRGPFGAAQDFQWADEAWEIKTVHPGSTFVQIASDSQLDTKQRPINLVVLPLAEVSDGSGYSLNELVVRLKARMGDLSEALIAFDDRLVAVGYMNRSEYDSPRFKAGKARTFRVIGEFPRIEAKDLIKGVTEVRYKVLLDACAPFETETLFTVA